MAREITCDAELDTVAGIYASMVQCTEYSRRCGGKGKLPDQRLYGTVE